ncbi:MAG: polysaccharide deacetylase family protein [Cryomorphaceae bacterium]
MYLKHTPSIIKPLAKDLVFDLPNDRKAIYVTFDDGPHPEITPDVLRLLDQYDAKATFFLIGKNAEEYPGIVKDIRAKGHSVGLHGYAHLSGWKTKNEIYVADIHRCHEHVPSTLFRPPYGEISLSQSKLLKKNYSIVMWSDLSADWDDSYSVEDCFRFATEKVKPGSIIVFHDSEKARPRMLKSLELALKFYADEGFVLEAIPMP